MTVTLHTAEEIDAALRQIGQRLDRVEAALAPPTTDYRHRRYLLIDHTKVAI